ncbi:nucleosome assembly protein [Dichotomopilus funicola]|uniref:Nucleosome assembly protein n=1 Tax=Dichotomopilus funicola TaxID=1934379 RepID=A0AAN6VBS5_9PEZI|nr:nucleosome assembly protein [Dichotomopilus funicola]
MASPLEETMISYEELSDLEQEFDDVETEIIRQQYALSKPLYARRAELLAKIPNFWPLVLEQAPMDIDEYIQPTDSNILLHSLKNLSVSRFELDEDEKNGDPRSFSIRFEFAENEHFDNSVLEKKFYWRETKDGFAGLVSEPLVINWKKGKDLTDGLLEQVKAVYDEQLAKPKKDPKDKMKEKVVLTEKQKALKEKMEKTGMGGISFFAFFGYIGEYVTAEESKEAIAADKEERRKRKAGEEVEKKDEDEDEDEDMEDADEEEDDDLDIFPMGDAVAMAIADDLWPGALKYFIQAQEQDGLSDLDFETDEDDDEEDEDEEEAAGASRPQKKHKGACAHGCKH